jgi:HlyD family secretion protein
VNEFTDSRDASPDRGVAERLGLASGASPKMRRFRKWYWIGGGVLVLAVIAWMFAGGHPKLSYVTQPVAKGSLTMTVNATGTLAPRVKVTVGAEVSGRIDTLYVDYNDRVKRGQKLAQINTEAIAAQLRQARATLAQSQATLIQTGATIKRYAELLKSNALSQQVYDTARGDYARAKAGVDQSSAQVQAYETQLAKATIYAPIDGVVLERKVSVGQTVAAAFSTPELYTLASDLSRMELDVNIDEADVGAVREGQIATFTVDAYPNKRFEARLISVHNASETVQNVVTYKGVLLVKNPDLLLKPGMTAAAEILTGKIDSAVLVPNAALRFIPADYIVKTAPPARTGTGLGRVWTVAGKGLKAHDLRLGGSNGRFTVMLSGDIKPGDQVVTDSKAAGGGSVSVSAQ